jgi:hypothetical protein
MKRVKKARGISLGEGYVTIVYNYNIVILQTDKFPAPGDHLVLYAADAMHVFHQDI